MKSNLIIIMYCHNMHAETKFTVVIKRLHMHVSDIKIKY